MRRLSPDKLPRHVAVIPDGNGRWAEARGLPRIVGHREGTERMREFIRAAHELGVRELSVYAFSSENWARPRDEVDALMEILDVYLERDADELCENGIRLQAIGRLAELPAALGRRLETVVRRTERNDQMLLTFALSYGGRAEIVDAARRLAREVEAGRLDPEAIDEKAFQAFLYAPDLSDPDLLIRTGVERRISNFLLWQLAYTELWFTDLLWPEVGKDVLVEALLAYQTRERRFGRTGAQIKSGS
jgi:undecaprenyl diphosphate synthase